MKSTRKISVYFLGLFALLAISLSSCVKNDFDAPPGDGEDPDIAVTTTIAQLKQQYTGTPFRITDDVVIKGVVISDDKEGNFYKSLVIQDSTAGILIRVDQTNLYTEFPVGRRVFVKCKNLWVGEYEGLIQMGAFLDTISDPQRPSVESIPTAVVSKYILKGKYNITVPPTLVTINQLQLTPSVYQNMLIQLQEIEFDNAELGNTYADAVNKFSRNRKMVDCNGSEILLRTSGYAKFAGDTIPTFQGTLNAVFSVFRTDLQLYINTPSDFQPNGNARCNDPSNANFATIASVRSLFTGSQTTVGSGKSIKGIVTSDRSFANIDGRNMVIQDSSAAIVVRFSSNHTFSLGDEVAVNISGQRLSEFNGLLQVEVPNANAQKIGTGTVSPRTITVSQAVSNLELYESQLVIIQGAQLSGNSGKYGGNVTINDGTGTISMFTRNAATFASNNYPSGVVSVIGILSQFNSAQILIRNPNDIQQ